MISSTPTHIQYGETFCLSYPLPVSPSVATTYILGSQPFSCYYLVYQTSPCHIRRGGQSRSQNRDLQCNVFGLKKSACGGERWASGYNSNVNQEFIHSLLDFARFCTSNRSLSTCSRLSRSWYISMYRYEMCASGIIQIIPSVGKNMCARAVSYR